MSSVVGADLLREARGSGAGKVVRGTVLGSTSPEREACAGAGSGVATTGMVRAGEVSPEPSGIEKGSASGVSKVTITSPRTSGKRIVARVAVAGSVALAVAMNFPMTGRLG